MNLLTKLALSGLAAATLVGLAALPFMERGLAKAEDEIGDPERGRELALNLCSGCHAVAPNTQSPVPEAPPFDTFAQRFKIEDLEEALAEGIMVGHEKYQMPVFQFDTAQIADLIAYLKSIQRPAEPAQ